jgi:hypothetical protein
MSERAVLDATGRQIQQILDRTSDLRKESENVLNKWSSLSDATNSVFGHVQALVSHWVKGGSVLKAGSQVVSELAAGSHQHTVKYHQALMLARAEWTQIEKARQTGEAYDVSELEAAKQKYDFAKRNFQLIERYNSQQAKMGPGQFGMFSVLLLAGINELLDRTREWNKSLTAGNELLTKRSSILQDVFTVQTQTGSSQRDLAESLSAMVEYGLESRNGFAENLKLVTQLRQGLNLSASDAADLAYISSQLRISFKDVADSMARIVDSTALSAQEAKKYADQIGRAALFLGQTGRSQVGGPAGSLEFIGRLEGAIKEAGGVQGEFAKLVSDMTSTLEGSLQAGVFGLTPEMLAGAGSKQLFKQITDLVTTAQKFRDAGNTQGYLAVLEQIKALTGDRLSAQTLNSMVEAQRRLTAQRSQALTIEQKWQNELQNTGKAFAQVKQIVLSLILDGLMPFASVARGLMGAIQSVVLWIQKVPAIAKTLSAVITLVAAVSIPFLIAKMWQLTTSFIIAAQAARILATQTLANAGLSGISNVGSTVAGTAAARGTLGKMFATLRLGKLGTMFTSFFARIPQIIAASGGIIAGIVGAALGGYFVGTLIRKWLNTDRIADLLTTSKMEFARVAAERSSQNMFSSSFRKQLRGAESVDEIQQLTENAKRIALATKIFGEGPAALGRIQLLMNESRNAARFLADVKSGKAQVSNVATQADIQSAENERRQTDILTQTLETQRQIFAEASKQARTTEQMAMQEKEREIRERLLGVTRQNYGWSVSEPRF